MENENNVELEDEKIEEGEETVEEEKTPEKKSLTPEQQKGIKQRQFTKLAKELGIELPKAKEEEKTNNINGFDYGQMAYLEAKGIPDEAYPIVLEAMKSTGKPLRDVLASKYVQAELKEFKEARETQEAVPNGSKRSTTSARDSVEYWLAKGELPPAGQRELRSKVLNARIKAEQSKSVFD